MQKQCHCSKCWFSKSNFVSVTTSLWLHRSSFRITKPPVFDYHDICVCWKRKSQHSVARCSRRLCAQCQRSKDGTKASASVRNCIWEVFPGSGYGAGSASCDCWVRMLCSLWRSWAFPTEHRVHKFGLHYMPTWLSSERPRLILRAHGQRSELSPQPQLFHNLWNIMSHWVIIRVQPVIRLIGAVFNSTDILKFDGLLNWKIWFRNLFQPLLFISAPFRAIGRRVRVGDACLPQTGAGGKGRVYTF